MKNLHQRPGIAVWKSMLRKLPKEEFAQYAMLFGSLMNQQESNTSAYFYYLTLYTWCKHHYQSNFFQQPNLFAL